MLINWTAGGTRLPFVHTHSYSERKLWGSKGCSSLKTPSLLPDFSLRHAILNEMPAITCGLAKPRSCSWNRLLILSVLNLNRPVLLFFNWKDFFCTNPKAHKETSQLGLRLLGKSGNLSPHYLCIDLFCFQRSAQDGLPDQNPTCHGMTESKVSKEYVTKEKFAYSKQQGF